MEVLWVFLGGGLGSLCRFLISKWQFSQSIFPYQTFTANLISSFILGVIMAFVISRNDENSALRFFIAIGFCGGFSTFSTFSYETFELMRTENYTTAILNVLVSITTCLGAIGAGLYIGRNF